MMLMLKFHLIAQKRRNKIEKLLIPIKSNPKIYLYITVINSEWQFQMQNYPYTQN